MSHAICKVVDELVVEKGERSNDHHRATITSGEILERLGNKTPTPNEHRSIRIVVGMHYPNTAYESIGVNGRGGWILHMKIRSKK